MIERYATKQMKDVWSAENKFSKWLDLEIYALEANVKLGRVPESALAIIKTKAKFDVARIDAIEKEINHDVIAFLTNLAESIGPESRYVHLGLTSSDVVDTCLSVLLNESTVLMITALEKLMVSIKEKALVHKDTPMIGRTHGIHAEPMTLGLKFSLWYEELNRSLCRLKAAQKTIAVGKISGAVGTYANIDPFVESFVCEKLGLTPASISTQILQRDRHAEWMAALAILASSLEKFSTEIRNLQRTDLGELAEPFGKLQKGSSAMPHKRNPILCERISGLARVIRGYAVSSFENISLWHERDITHSSVERVIFPDASSLVEYMLITFNYVVEGLEVYPENMKTNLEKYGGIVNSQRVLLKLIEKGLTREDAYRLVQREALRARDENGSFRRNLEQNNEITKLLSLEEIDGLFDHRYHLRNVPLIMKRIFGV